jgi:hypothetical protein
MLERRSCDKLSDDKLINFLNRVIRHVARCRSVQAQRNRQTPVNKVRFVGCAIKPLHPTYILFGSGLSGLGNKNSIIT